MTFAGISWPLGQSNFRAGVEVGLVAVAVAVIVGAAWRRHTGNPAPVGGVLLALAATVALGTTATAGASVPRGLAIALCLLALGGLVGDLFRSPSALRVVLAVPGGLVLATQSGLSGAVWIRVLVLATSVVGGALVADFDRRHRGRSLALPLFAVSALGVYYTVPDTEQALALLGVCLVVAVAAWPVPFVSLGSSGSFAATGALAWVVAVGGAGRPGATVGGVACLALLVVEPLSRVSGAWRDRGRLFGTSAWSVLPVASIQLLLVALASRAGAIR